MEAKGAQLSLDQKFMTLTHACTHARHVQGIEKRSRGINSFRSRTKLSSTLHIYVAPPSSFITTAWLQNTEINSCVPASELNHSLSEMEDPVSLLEIRKHLFSCRHSFFKQREAVEKPLYIFAILNDT